jgi:hypothetical protein
MESAGIAGEMIPKEVFPLKSEVPEMFISSEAKW